MGNSTGKGTVAALLHKPFLEDAITENIPELVRQWQLAELRALEMLKQISPQKKRALAKKEKQEVLDILIDYGITLPLFILVGYALGADASIAGRPMDDFKRNLIMNYFLKEGHLPEIRSGSSGRRKKNDADDGIIARCARAVDQKLTSVPKTILSKEHNSSRAENTRCLITKVLKNKDFRKTYEDRLSEYKKALSKPHSQIAEIFVRHIQCIDMFK